MRISDWSSDVCSSDLIKVVDGPNQISRENGKRRVVVQANVRGRDVGSVVADAQAPIASQVRLPAGTYLEWGGQFDNLPSASERLKMVIPACFILILLLLYGALGSVRDAAIVFTGVPFEIGRAHVRTPVTNAQLVCR